MPIENRGVTGLERALVGRLSLLPQTLLIGVDNSLGRPDLRGYIHVITEATPPIVYSAFGRNQIYPQTPEWFQLLNGISSAKWWDSVSNGPAHLRGELSQKIYVRSTEGFTPDSWRYLGIKKPFIGRFGKDPYWERFRDLLGFSEKYQRARYLLHMTSQPPQEEIDVLDIIYDKRFPGAVAVVQEPQATPQPLALAA